MARERVPAAVPAGEGAAAGPDDSPPPPFGTAIPADPVGALPRTVSPLERAPSGVSRFKIDCRNYDNPPRLYILAADEASARALYLKESGVEAMLAKLKASGVKDPELPALVIVKLAD